MNLTLCHVSLTQVFGRAIESPWPAGGLPAGRGEGGGRRGYVKNRLKVLRAERDWSQAELGGRLGVSRQAVNAIETGKYDPSLPLAFKLSRLFRVPIEEIFDDGVGAPGDAR
jgi:putative transcriptional regulator